LKDMICAAGKGARTNKTRDRTRGVILSIVRHIYNCMVIVAGQPASMAEGLMRPLDKEPGNREVKKVGEFRPICWTTTLSKWISAVANQRVVAYAEKHGLFG